MRAMLGRSTPAWAQGGGSLHEATGQGVCFSQYIAGIWMILSQGV